MAYRETFEGFSLTFSPLSANIIEQQLHFRGWTCPGVGHVVGPGVRVIPQRPEDKF